MRRFGVWTRSAETVFAALLVAVPSLAFYIILIRLSHDLPKLDDYHALLEAANRLRNGGSFGAKIVCLLATQHNEYKLWLDTGAAWLELALLGHLNFRSLCLLGDSFVLPLAILLWTLFLPDTTDRAKRLLLFVPVSCLLFQLSYAETLNWAMAGLQNLPVIFFSFLSIVLLVRGARSSFWLAAASMVLAIAASGNGALVAPIGAIILMRRREYGRLAVWIVTTIATAAAYVFRYSVPASQAGEHRTVLTALHHFNPVYPIAFLGAYGTRRGCVVLGVLICMAYGYLAFTGYFKKHSAIGYCVLFIVLTAIGVAGLRSEFGIIQAASSRYRIYSIVLLIFLWFRVTESILASSREAFRMMTAAAVLVAAALCLGSDRAGARLMRDREIDASAAMEAYQRSMLSDPSQGRLVSQSDVDAILKEENIAAPQDLEVAAKLGVYSPSQ